MPTFKNARTQDRDNLPICPVCLEAIGHGHEAAPDGDFMLHLACFKASTRARPATIPVPVGGPRQLTPLAEAIAAFLRQTEPRGAAPPTYCFVCLADNIQAPEQSVREASQQLVVTWEWRLTERMCYGCGTVGEFLERRPRPRPASP